MESFIHHLVSLQRNDIDNSSKLKRITQDKLRIIVGRTNIAEEMDTKNFGELQQQCWLWNGQTTVPYDGHRHGVIWFGENYVPVHRLMFHNFIGNVPIYVSGSNSLQVNHRCTHNNDGGCVNPWHLYLGTPQQNTNDSIQEGTAYGRYRQPVFCDEVAKELVKLREDGFTRLQLAEHFHVTPKTLGVWIAKLNIKFEDKFDEELKNRVVEEKMSGKMYKDLIDEYDVSKSSIVRWVREYKRNENA